MGNKIKILAIDDNPDNLTTLKALIMDSFPDAVTLTALNGEDGIDMAKAEDPDIILLDIVMPVMDGFDVCKKLKSNSLLSDIPVVFITAQKGDKENRIHALGVGADGFLAKPIDENELIAQIRAMVKIKLANVEKRNEKERLSGLIEEQTLDLHRAHLATLNLLEDLKAEIEVGRKNEEAIMKSEERFRTLIENAFDGIYLTNGKYFYFVNHSFCEIVGYSARELTSPDFNFNVNLSGENSALVNDSTILRRMDKKVPGTYEVQVKTKEGSYKTVEISTVNLGIGDDLNVMGIVRDITERRRIESQIIQSERLSALGEMSAGMAHEINQPLNTLSILFDNILYEAKNTHSVSEEYLAMKTEKVFNNILRIRNLIDHVREFSRSHEGYILNMFSINKCILNALSMVSEQFKIAGIEIFISLDENLPDIKGNTFKFEQVVLNFISNSKDALLEKKNRLNETYPMLIKINTRFDKHYIYLKVEDNGIGIKKENIDKVLQPFYTTKDTGKGTGLGLSISYGLIQELHGKIAISSTVLIGTAISVTVPIKPDKLL
jgi:PAS domain S-box-containing protein